MPLLRIVASKKITAIVTIEDATAKQIDQYAAMTKGSADDVIQAALDYVFSTDKDFAGSVTSTQRRSPPFHFV